MIRRSLSLLHLLFQNFYSLPRRFILPMISDVFSEQASVRIFALDRVDRILIFQMGTLTRASVLAMKNSEISEDTVRYYSNGRLELISDKSESESLRKFLSLLNNSNLSYT